MGAKAWLGGVATEILFVCEEEGGAVVLWWCFCDMILEIYLFVWLVSVIGYYWSRRRQRNLFNKSWINISKRTKRRSYSWWCCVGLWQYYCYILFLMCWLCQNTPRLGFNSLSQPSYDPNHPISTSTIFPNITSNI